MGCPSVSKRRVRFVSASHFLSAHLQLPLQPLGGDRESRSKFLGKDRNLEFFDHPPKFIEACPRLRRGRLSRLKLTKRSDEGLNHSCLFLIFRRIQQSAISAHLQRFQISGEVLEASET